jgi:hypothetical protein
VDSADGAAGECWRNSYTPDTEELEIHTQFWQSLSERPNIFNPSKTKSESAVMSDQNNVIDRFLRTGDSLWSATPIPQVRLQLVEVHVVDGRDVERHDLREEQPTHHG